LAAAQLACNPEAARPVRMAGDDVTNGSLNDEAPIGVGAIVFRTARGGSELVIQSNREDVDVSLHAQLIGVQRQHGRIQRPRV
jgi:hypothetical protein